MLKLFEVSGFKNFSHKISLDLSDVRDYRFNEHCIKDGLLRNCIIYGKNSSGKSNFSLAVFDIVAHLTGNNVSPDLYNSYINANNIEGKAQFRYVFQFGNDIVEYLYIKSSNKTLITENVALNGKYVFVAGYNSITASYVEINELSERIDMSFFTGGSLVRHALSTAMLGAEHPLHKMMVFVSKMLWFRSLDENRFIGNKTAAEDYHSFILDNDSTLAEFQELLTAAGINSKISVEKDADGKKRLYSSEGEDAKIPFLSTASSGTKALYAFFYWYKTAPDTSLLFIDEFDAYYHFELSETIVELLGKRYNTQIMLTSHNTNLLTNRIMRPDCYFILTPEKLTSFANATKRELREGHNLEKLYASGEFYE